MGAHQGILGSGGSLGNKEDRGETDNGDTDDDEELEVREGKKLDRKGGGNCKQSEGTIPSQW